MKRISIPILSLLLTVIAIIVLWATSSPPNEPSSNFSFRFEFGACNTDVLDTFEGTFTQDRIVESSVTIPFQLSESQMTVIYQKMLEIHFFDYPEEFVVPDPVGIQTPSPEYHITVRNGEKTKKLHWVADYFNPADRQSVNLDELFTLIMKMVWDSPEFKKLPDLKAGCL